MMILLILLQLLAAGWAVELEVDASCPTCVIVNTTCYNTSHVLDLTAPFRNHVVIHKMKILRPENTLFYSFEPKIEDPEYYKIGFVKLDKPDEAGVITSEKLIANFGAFDIDQDNSVVYLGGSDGIFALNTADHKLSPYSSRGDTIKSIFYKSNVYFVKNDVTGITVKKGDKFQILFEDIEVNIFVINKYDVVVFSNRHGLFVGKGETVIGLSHNPFFRGLAIDLEEQVYAWWIDGIYRVIIEKDLKLSRIVKIADLPYIGAMAFDNDNYILFTNERGLFRMQPTEFGCRIKPVKNYK